ncbi:MAG TPA: preprotein translocase subunit YajC [Acidimicrobiales bacterium]|nr:preprotein translocase subunit YajC [Acidimicrobiales bacterium]
MSSVLILPLIFVIGYFLLVRPQQQQVRRQRALVSSLHVGAEVQTAGGIVGRIIDLDDQFVQLQVGPGTTITFIRSAVQQVLNPADASPDLDETGPADPFGADLPSEEGLGSDEGLGLGETPVVEPPAPAAAPEAPIVSEGPLMDEPASVADEPTVIGPAATQSLPVNPPAAAPPAPSWPPEPAPETRDPGAGDDDAPA